jgi:hypothetical protein
MKIETLFPLTISDSSLSDLYLCELAWFRKYCQKLSTSVHNPDLIAGKAFARACELTRKAYYNDKVDEEDAVAIGYEYILNSEDTYDTKKSLERIAFCFKKYFETFPLQYVLPPCELIDGTHAVEYKFKLDLGIPHPDIPNVNICLTGILDYLCEEYIMGKPKRYILDEKTAGKVFRNSDGSVDKAKEALSYKTAGQFLCYALAAKQLGIECNDALIRKVPIMEKYTKAFELQIHYNDWAIVQWFISTRNKVIDLVEKYKLYKSSTLNSVNIFTPVYHHNCTAYGRPCTYMDGCISKEGEEIMLHSMPQMVWDSEEGKVLPLKEYKIKLGI